MRTSKGDLTTLVLKCGIERSFPLLLPVREVQPSMSVVVEPSSYLTWYDDSGSVSHSRIGISVRGGGGGEARQSSEDWCGTRGFAGRAGAFWNTFFICFTRPLGITPTLLFCKSFKGFLEVALCCFESDIVYLAVLFVESCLVDVWIDTWMSLFKEFQLSDFTRKPGMLSFKTWNKMCVAGFFPKTVGRKRNTPCMMYYHQWTFPLWLEDSSSSHTHTLCIQHSHSHDADVDR